MASIKCGNCKSTHSNVAEVRACYTGKVPATTTVDKATESAFGGLASAFPAKALGPKGTFDQPATEKQVAYIASLRDSRGLEPLAFAGTKKQASTEIERLMALPKAKATTKASSSPIEEPADGIYIVRGEGQFYSEAQVFKVYKMVHGSGRQGLKRLEIVAGEQQGENTGKFVYVGLASKHLPKDAERLSLEEAKTFGTLYGVCVRCGATLTDEESKAAGIGPICAGKM